MLGWKRGIVYAYSVLEYPLTGKREWWGYVGQTRQELVDRHNQHMGYDNRQEAQPWSDLYPEIRVVVCYKYCPKWLLDLTEELIIKFKFPLYNYIHNTKNPRRIPKYQAVADRKQRNLNRSRTRGRV